MLILESADRDGIMILDTEPPAAAGPAPARPQLMPSVIDRALIVQDETAPAGV
jgi:hypothetical protein